MCTVLDLCGKVVLAWKIDSDMSSSLEAKQYVLWVLFGGVIEKAPWAGVL